MQLTWIGFYPWQQISEFVTCKGDTNMKVARGMQNIENRLGYLPFTNKYFPTFHLPCNFILLCQFCWFSSFLLHSIFVSPLMIPLYICKFLRRAIESIKKKKKQYTQRIKTPLKIFWFLSVFNPVTNN